MSTNDFAALFLLDFHRMQEQIQYARSYEAKRFIGNYPPVDIVRKDDNWVIQLALAGYAKDDVEVTTHDNQLVVKSVKQPDTERTDDVQYIHRGISKRSFERRWQMEADMEVVGASFENGMLTIGVTRIVPDEKKPKIVPIGGSSKNLHDKLLTT